MWMLGVLGIIVSAGVRKRIFVVSAAAVPAVDMERVDGVAVISVKRQSMYLGSNKHAFLQLLKFDISGDFWIGVAAFDSGFRDLFTAISVCHI